MTASRVIAILLIVAACAGCGQAPRLRPLSGSSVVLAFGDSLTAGVGATKARSYPSELAGLLGCRVINAGVPGEDTTAARRRLPGMLRRVRPDLVVLCHGGNDLLQRQDTNVTGENLDAMVAMIKKANADVLLIAVPRPGLLLRPPPFYEEVAGKHDIPLERDVLASILSEPELKDDRVHPNAAGYRQLAAAVAELIGQSRKE